MRCEADVVVQRIMAACFEPARPVESEGLEPFQQDAVARLRVMLDRRGGAILADSVGLGKTHVAAALIREEVGRGGDVLVTAPAELKSHWARHLRGARWRWISHTSMSRRACDRHSATLVVVDEAHAFRNPSTKRYAALAFACEQARVLLLSATPVNNSLLDFYNLVHLFAADDAFVDIGVPDMRAAFEAARRTGGSAGVRRIADTIMVRRTREMVALWGSRTRLSFPQSGDIEVLEYDLSDACPGLAECAAEVIPALAFPAHSVPDPAVRELLRLGLLKRLESGSWAFGASIRRHILLLGWFIEAARAGLLFDACAHGGHAPPADGAVQLMLDPLVLPPWPPSRDRDGSIGAAMRDLHGLMQMKARLLEGTDPKLDRLRTLLDDELKDETVLLFTEYRDTAHGIWRSLARRAGIGMIHGSDARLGLERASRRSIIHRFAPRSNGARTPRDAERVRVLIATDVLAEGLDLQDARVLISWDLPWNPVRLAQRIGRIDRLGSPHARIRAIAFRPDPRIDALLGLTRRIRRKLRQIRCVGGDAPAWRDRRRSRRISRELDEAARARESLRVRYLVARRPPGGEEVSGAGAGTIAAVNWRGPNEAALCCFRTHAGEVLLVLTSPGGPAEVNTAAAWSALEEAGRSPPAAAPTAAPARQAEHAARRALSAGWSRDRTGAPARAAATYVGAWLASRPGGPTDEEVDVADRLLLRLATGARAGTELRLKRLLAPAHPAEDGGGRLEEWLREAGTAPANPWRRAATEAELIGTIVLRPDRRDATINPPNRPS